MLKSRTIILRQTKVEKETSMIKRHYAKKKILNFASVSVCVSVCVCVCVCVWGGGWLGERGYVYVDILCV